MFVLSYFCSRNVAPGKSIDLRRILFVPMKDGFAEVEPCFLKYLKYNGFDLKQMAEQRCRRQTEGY
jgi:hypothetical protein